MRVAVTGSHGFIGRDVARALREAGHDVVGLVRSPAPPGTSPLAERFFDLETALDPAVLDGIETVIHCAFVRATSATHDAYRINVEGTIALAEATSRAAARFVLLSSLSAIPGAQSVYGRQKWELERRLAGNADVVRPGLVIGKGGLVENLVSAMRRLRVAPLIDRGMQPIQPVWLHDLSALLLALIERRDAPRTWTVAADPPLTVAGFTRDVARAFGLRVVTLSLPFPIAYAASRWLESRGLPTPLATESLLGLAGSQVQPADDVGPLGVVLMPWSEQCLALALAFSAASARG